ncbi:SPOSA6832_03760 [Sporobolomyces salmonicolor]|uniref:SPOSA6832_03760-mRNA-1:cds n=1 Tax=Sporidiobolus salmonicolor TaxID=5005 RepID=A0A0D6EPI8_SPOSA|nr:SPOSA6832_03760 [Sporobolomyces salmonicolor]
MEWTRWGAWELTSPISLPAFGWIGEEAYVADFDKFKSKHVDAIYCISSNDLFVMSAWGRVMKAGDKVVCISDPELAWLKQVGLTQDREFISPLLRPAKRTVTYIGVESSPGVGPSGAEAVLAKL